MGLGVQGGYRAVCGRSRAPLARDSHISPHTHIHAARTPHRRTPPFDTTQNLALPTRCGTFGEERVGAAAAARVCRRENEMLPPLPPFLQSRSTTRIAVLSGYADVITLLAYSQTLDSCG